MPPFPVLGLSGGIATGKSHLAAWLAGRGWVVVDADQVAREIVRPPSETLDLLVDHFGPGILQGGELDRAALGRRIFEDPEARRCLEAILHPRIEAALADRVRSLPEGTRGVVLEAALWMERGKAHHFDAFWVVEAPEPLRLRRLMDRDGLAPAEASARLRAQSTSAEKALHADRVFLNDGRSLMEALEEAEGTLLADWQGRRSRALKAPMTDPFDSGQLRRILEILLSRGGDFAELFGERRTLCSLGLDDGRMEDLLSSESLGVSLRLVDGDTTRFADLIAPSFEDLEEAARLLAAPGTGEPREVPDLVERVHPTPVPVLQDPREVPLQRKVELVKRAESLAREHAESLRPGALRQVAVGYGDSTQEVWIASVEVSLGPARTTLTGDRRIQGVLRVNVTAGEGDQLQSGYQPLGEARGFELFEDAAVARTAREAARLAVLGLESRPAPSGTFPVLLHSSAGGTLIHEACGHGLEADLALAGMSAFAGMLGQRVAAEGVTIIDDGTLPHQRGSAAMDDEGAPTTRVVLIENGILRNFLQSRKTARRMGVQPTGNGRRESYRHLPIPRMRNTFLAPGTADPEAMLQGLKEGLLVKRMGGGQVDTVTGNFVFQVTEGYWIEDGKVHHPVKNATLSGCGPEVLKDLQQIGSDLEHFDIGTCGKDGQGVPVSDALPTILCPALVVGGTATPLPTLL
ncbi:MAG: dephospho-CoA kinase [Acidobacteria bacterium]|nr:dephospho-CoA kinase [Acidobacteriota bacterium]